MQVREAMTTPVRLAAPNQTLAHAAQMMSEIDSGFLPVAEGDRLIGVITDRDIALRGVAFGRGPDAHVRDVMSSEVRYCFEDEDLADVSRNMAAIQVRRLPVMSREKRLVGMLSLGDIAARADAHTTGQTLEGVARSSDQHNQSARADWENQGGAFSAV